jgi:2-amino-4-hydroxy-6-hydroxymethyldihydropteridine diphosphokinase
MPAHGFDAIIALGSNLGDKAANIAQAIERLTARGDVTLVSRSADYRTEPWGNTDQDWFVNACIGVATQLAPHALLARCLEVERELGRTRSTRWGPRVIDLDILVYRNETIATSGLTLPHPRIAERAFVLVPLAEIAPDLTIQGRRVGDLVGAVDTSGIVRL